jgi:hypothetical protein
MPKRILNLIEIQKQKIIKRLSDKGERIFDLTKEFKTEFIFQKTN